MYPMALPWAVLECPFRAYHASFERCSGDGELSCRRQALAKEGVLKNVCIPKDRGNEERAKRGVGVFEYAELFG